MSLTLTQTLFLAIGTSISAVGLSVIGLRTLRWMWKKCLGRKAEGF